MAMTHDNIDITIQTDTNSNSRDERERSKSVPHERNGEVEFQDGNGRGGRKKYSRALHTLLPYRKDSIKRGKLLPSSHAGLFSFVTYTWLTPIMWKAFRQGLTSADLWDLHDSDKAEGNAKRLSRIWQEEQILLGKDAKFLKAVWKFGRTRFYVCIFLMILSVIFQFLGPAWILKSILTYQEDLSQPLELGIVLAVLAFWAQLMRNLTFSAVWGIGIHTGMRVEGAMQFMTYEKMLKLRNGGENVLGKTISFCASDQERIFECVSGGVLAFAAPIMFLLCLTYTCVVIGPWAILGNVVIFLFYPIMGIIARVIGQIRRKAVKHTTKRVGLMTEILNSIRLIKMYGWEDSFLQKVKEIRTGEEEQLKKAAFLGSMTATLTPMVNIIASIAVFLAYSLSGNNLTPAVAFTIFSVFSAMQFTIGTLPFAIRSIAEAAVCFGNFQKFLALPEFEVVTDPDLECDHDSVIAVKDANFAWEVEKEPEIESKETPNNDATKTKKNQEKKPKIAKVKQTKTKDQPNGNVDVEEEEALTNIPKVEETLVLEDCLKGVNLEIKRGSLIGVAGSVGSGKSSLLSAILGDMVKTSGRILIRGSLAIVSQQAWIYSDSLQENILFGSPMNKEKYDRVLDICCLRPDIQALTNGDLTLVGERGVNLSGGQKQRVNLARAIYADKSIYLLDDPLSAVDSVIAKEIFEKCIKSHLKDKTVILVTSGIQFLEECDDIIFFKNGEISERGTHSELVVNKGNYYNIVQYHNQDTKTEEELPLLPLSPKDPKLVRESSKSKLRKISSPVKSQIETFAQKIAEDDSKYNFAGIKSYLLYLKASGGYLLFLVLLVFFTSFVMARLFATIWLQLWLDAGDGLGLEEERRQNNTELNETYSSQDLKGFVNDNPSLWFYQLILSATVFVSLFVGLIKGFLSSRFVLRGASNLHQKMLVRIVKSPMSFFDATPAGKITNRFSKDMDELDARLPFFFEFVIQSVIYVLLSLVITCVVYPIFAVGMIIILGAMIFLDIWLNISVRETRKLENVLQSPVLHHLQSSLSGLSIIRTFHRQDQFKSRFSSYVNNHLAAETVYRAANRWFTVRMDCVGLLTIFSIILISIFLRGSVTPALVGLALTSVYTVCTFVPFVCRMKSELQARFLSVERILEYSEELVEEEPESKVVIKPKDGWPTDPEIKFESVSMRYQTDLPLVIEDVSFVIRPAEKIGIVGRTGAGKTSIIASLLRLYPIDQGKILINDLDICDISLKNLRNVIAVISQDPVLFHGTLRYNLDPFDEHTDEELWAALEKSYIKQRIEREEKKLLQPVSTDGENFSVGEKQLICLSRALLRKNKILLLDEATASLDIETDFLIQNTIHEAFKSCTVITIAHRLNTVANYDRILVMEKGKVLELDTPQNLMEKEESLFHKMVIASGISNLDQLKMQPGTATSTSTSPTT